MESIRYGIRFTIRSKLVEWNHVTAKQCLCLSHVTAPFSLKVKKAGSKSSVCVVVDLLKPLSHV